MKPWAVNEMVPCNAAVNIFMFFSRCAGRMADCAFDRLLAPGRLPDFCGAAGRRKLFGFAWKACAEIRSACVCRKACPAPDSPKNRRLDTAPDNPHLGHTPVP